MSLNLLNEGLQNMINKYISEDYDEDEDDIRLYTDFYLPIYNQIANKPLIEFGYQDDDYGIIRYHLGCYVIDSNLQPDILPSVADYIKYEMSQEDIEAILGDYETADSFFTKLDQFGRDHGRIWDDDIKEIINSFLNRS